MNRKTLIVALLCLIKQEFVAAQCWNKVSSGLSHTLGLQSDGSLWGWGSAGDLGIGIPTVPYYDYPIQIGTETDWADISAGGNFSLAIKKNGSLWAWGSSPNAILGGNDTTHLTAYNPVQIGTDYDWVQISAGGNHALALKSNRTLWGWGLSNEGQVGNGSSTCTFCPPIYQPVPNQIGSSNDWKQISACQNFSSAIKFNGTLWCWGSNSPSLINNSLPLNSTPTQLGTDTSWSMVDGGEYTHLLALKMDGTLWTWGYDITTNMPFILIPMPSQIGSDRDWVNINAGGDHDMAIKNNGTLWSWGRNSIGQMGNGSVGVVQPAPQMILPIMNNNFSKISGGYQFSMGIQTNGSLWGWGANTWGSLGIGNTQNQSTPQSVTCNPVNTDDEQIHNRISLSPNPTTGLLYLSIDNTPLNLSFQIYNSLGEIVLTERVTSIKTVIETSGLMKGIYLLRFQNDCNHTVRFIKD